jgi:hypothetical protein
MLCLRLCAGILRGWTMNAERKPKLLVACEYSGIVRDAFAARGWDAWSCDLLPTERPGQHIQGDVLDMLNDGFDLLIAHPPCTYLTNAGVRHLYSIPSRNGKLPEMHGERRWQAMRDAAVFFNALKNAPVPMICIENPVPHGHARGIIGNYSQLIQPWQFGHGETKATCLWLKNLPPLLYTCISAGREARIHRMSPGKDRAKERAKTFEGIALAMATQWGNLAARKETA